MSEKRRLITNTAANGIAQFANLFAGLILMPLLIRGFGLNDYGLYMLAVAVASYASIADLGVGAAVVKLVAESVARDDDEGVHRLASTAVAFYLAIGVCVAAIITAVAVNTGSIFNVSADGARLLRNLLLVTAVASVFTWPLNAATAVLQGFHRFTVTARTSVLVVTGNIVATVVVLAMHQGPVVLLSALSVVTITGGVINAFAASPLVRHGWVSPLAADRAVFREIVNFSWAVFVIQVCVLIVYQQTDRLVLGIFVGAVSVTLYEAAGKFQGLVAQVSSFAGSAVMPVASELDAQGRRSALQTLFIRGTKYAIALVAPMVVVLMVLAKPILQRWLGPEFAAQSLATQILIAHQVLTISTVVGDNIIVGLGKLPKRLPNALGLTIGNLALSLLLVKPLGIMGVVLGTSIPYFIDFPLHLRLLLRETGVTFGRFLKTVVAPTYPALVVPLGCALVTLATPLRDTLVGLAVGGVVAVGAYWLAVFAWGLSDVERAEVQQLLSRIRARLSA